MWPFSLIRKKKVHYKKPSYADFLLLSNILPEWLADALEEAKIETFEQLVEASKDPARLKVVSQECGESEVFLLELVASLQSKMTKS